MKTFVAGTVRFLGEQDGPPERLLKQRLAEQLTLSGDVERAYLARAWLGTDGGSTVALCLRSGTGSQAKIVELVGSVFSELFNTKMHMDVLFLTDEQESQLRAVCSPFFVKTP